MKRPFFSGRGNRLVIGSRQAGTVGPTDVVWGVNKVNQGFVMSSVERRVLAHFALGRALAHFAFAMSAFFRMTSSILPKHARLRSKNRL